MKNENTQHTPAPWQIVKSKKIWPNDLDSWHIFSQPDKDKMYETVCHTDSEANAQLIARAPELLKENEQLKEHLKITEEAHRKAYQDHGVTLHKVEELKDEFLQAFKHIQDCLERNNASKEDRMRAAINTAKAAIAKAEKTAQ